MIARHRQLFPEITPDACCEQRHAKTDPSLPDSTCPVPAQAAGTGSVWQYLRYGILAAFTGRPDHLAAGLP